MHQPMYKWQTLPFNSELPKFALWLRPKVAEDGIPPCRPTTKIFLCYFSADGIRVGTLTGCGSGTRMNAIYVHYTAFAKK